MKDYIKTIPFTTVVLLYMFFCGGLNLVGYWGTFDIKISEWVTIWEIPKAVITPFALLMSIFFVYEVVRRVSINHSIVFFRRKSRKESFSSHFVRFYPFNWKIVYVVLLPIMFFSFRYLYLNIFYWVTLSIYISIGFMQLLKENIKIFRRLIIRYSFASSLIAYTISTPMFCFVLGKLEGIIVYNNAVTNTINKNIISNITDTSKIKSIKFLGVLGDKYIMSDLENTKLFVVEKDGKSGIEIRRPNFENGKMWLLPNENSLDYK